MARGLASAARGARGRGRSAEGLLCLLTDPVDAALIAAAPELRAISNWRSGVDNIDVAAATARGIPVGHTPEVLTDSTADLAVGLMLAIARRITEGERVVRAGEWGTWAPKWMLGRDLHGATVAIVGGGRIGRAVAATTRGVRLRARDRGARAGRARHGARARGLRNHPHAAHRPKRAA